MFRPRLLVLIVVATALTGCGGSTAVHPRTGHPSKSALKPQPAPVPIPTGSVSRTVSVGAPMNAPAIAPGFVGLSLEQDTLPYYVGTNPHALNPVFLQLVRNLTPGQRPVLRFGGDSTDKSWFPVPGVPQPPWVTFTFTPSWLAQARALAGDLNARMIVGVNFEAGNATIAATEARGLRRGLGLHTLQALELGNEPELYSGFTWYKNAAGVGIRGRTPSWDPALYAVQAAAFARRIGDVPVAGPAVGSVKWITALPTILGIDHHISLVTVHAYPLKRCKATTHVTAAQLLAAASSTGLAAGIRPAVLAAARYHDRLRVGEMNSVSCGGEPGLSNTFATSLWSLDTLFSLARVGVSGVNFHTSPQVTNRLFAFAHARGQWSGAVFPVYYGILTFAKAAPAGSKLLTVAGDSDPSEPIWAVQTRTGAVHVVLINKRSSGTETVELHTRSDSGTATVRRLLAPSVTAQSGETFAGRSFGTVTSTGRLAGAPRVGVLRVVNGSVRVTVPAHSAALVSLG